MKKNPTGCHGPNNPRKKRTPSTPGVPGVPGPGMLGAVPGAFGPFTFESLAQKLVKWLVVRYGFRMF